MSLVVGASDSYSLYQLLILCVSLSFIASFSYVLYQFLILGVSLLFFASVPHIFISVPYSLYQSLINKGGGVSFPFVVDTPSLSSGNTQHSLSANTGSDPVV